MYLGKFGNLWEPFWNKKCGIYWWARKKPHCLCEDQIEKSIPQDHRLSSLGKPYDAKLWSLGGFFYPSKKEDKDQESIQSSTTPDPVYQWESNKLTTRHHKREPKGQPFPSRWPQGNKNRRAQKHNKHTTEITWMIHKRSTAKEPSVNIFYWRA